MKRSGILLFFTLFVALFGAGTGQAATKTSAGTGNWNVAGTWTPSGVPALNDDVIIANTHTVTVSASVAANPGTITINSGGQLTVGGFNLTVNGATTVAGTLLHNNTAGTHTYTGNVTINNGGTWSETAAAILSLAGNLQNDGTFTASTGIHTFSGAATKTFSGVGVISIPQVTITGAYQNNGTLTVGTALSGAGSLANGATGTLNLGGTSGITTLTATASGNTVNYTGGAQTVHNNNYHHLGLSGSGAKTLGTSLTTIGGNLTLSGTVSATTVIGLAITGNVNVGSGTTLTASHNLVVAGAASVTGTLTLSGSNTFSGGVALNATGRLNLNSATVLGGGTLTIAGGTIGNTSAGAVTLSTASPQNWNGDFAFAGTQNLNLGTGAVTMNNHRIITVSAGTLTVGGVIGGGAFNLAKAGTGILTLTGNNTFGGVLTVQAGTLSVPTLNDAGAAGPLGQSANPVVLGASSLTAGTLQYTGATAASTKPFNIDFGGVAQIDTAGTVLTLNGQINQIGSGLLTKTGPGTLVFGGADDNNGLGVIANAGTNILAKASNGGVHALGGAGLTIGGATVKLGGTGGDQIYDNSVDLTVNSGTLDFNGNNETIGGITGSGGTVLNNGGGASTMTLGANSSSSGNYAGVMANNTSGGGTLALVKIGAGTQTLSGANTYSGPTTVSAGNLTLSYTTQNNSKLSDTGVLTLGGGTLNLTGNAHTEVVGSTTIAPGASAVTRGSSTPVLRQNSMTRNVGGTVNFGAASLAQADNSLVNGILGGWATVAGADWATSGGVNDSPITALPAGSYTTTFAANNNVSINSSPAALNSVSINSLRMTAAATVTINSGQTLTLASGGLLATGSGATAITSGTLKGASGTDLVVHQNSSANLTISSTVADNTSATALTKSGTGRLILAGTANSYTGGTFVNAGLLDVEKDGGLGSGNIRVAGGATLLLANGATHNYVNDSATVSLIGSAVVNLSFAGSDVISGLLFDGVSQTAGTWGATGSGAAHLDDTHFTGTGKLTILGAASAYQITAATTTPNGGASDALTIKLVDLNGNTLTSYSGDKNLTFSGLSVADDGTHPTVTDKIGAAVALGTTTTITFASGQNSAGGTLMAYRAQGPVTLEATDGSLSTSTPGGAGLSLTIANVNPVAGADSYSRAPGISLKMLLSALLANDTDANHDLLSFTSVNSPSTQGATLAASGLYVFYTPNSAGTGDTFTYNLSDGHGGNASGTVTVNLATPGGIAQSIVAAGGTVTITFFGLPGFQYDLQRATLVNGPYSTIAGPQTAFGSDGKFTFTDTPGSGTFFYRSLQH